MRINDAGHLGQSTCTAGMGDRPARAEFERRGGDLGRTDRPRERAAAAARFTHCGQPMLLSEHFRSSLIAQLSQISSSASHRTFHDGAFSSHTRLTSRHCGYKFFHSEKQNAGT